MPVNRIPSEVLSLIPDYCDDGEDDEDADQDLITLTHVCRSWRDIFISRSSLWTCLDCTNVDKTRIYIQRSKSSPLEITINDSYLDDAFFPVTPHIRRIKSLIIRADALPGALRYFYCHTPLLKELIINLTCTHPPTLNSTLFNGDLSSLRSLSLSGVITHLPWKNLENLTTFNLKSYCTGRDFVTRLLNFFENAPLLRTITLEGSIPESSDAPSGRIVPLPHLSVLVITANPVHSTLLNHLRIPTEASLVLEFTFSGEQSPLQDCLPKTSANLGNLSHITAINLRFDTTQKFMRMSGPSGELRVLARWKEGTISHTTDRRILCSLDPFILSTTHRLTVSRYEHRRLPQVEQCPVFQTLSSVNNLHTLVLTECLNLPFILALNPEENSSKRVLCPNLEELILYIKSRDQFHIKHLIDMAKNRTLRSAKLSSVAIVGLGELVPGKEIFKLRKYIRRVQYSIDDLPPEWDHLPGESSNESE